MKLYYLIWVDFIVRAKSQPANKSNWQIMTLAFMTVIMAVDFLFLMMVLQETLLGFYFYHFRIPALSERISNIISVVILFGGPPLLLNYLLIFRNRRYEKLIQKYEYHNGKLAVTYMLLGLFIPFAVLVSVMMYGV